MLYKHLLAHSIEAWKGLLEGGVRKDFWFFLSVSGKLETFLGFHGRKRRPLIEFLEFCFSFESENVKNVIREKAFLKEIEPCPHPQMSATWHLSLPFFPGFWLPFLLHLEAF